MKVVRGMTFVAGSLGRIVLIMVVLLVAGLIMGQRAMHELSLFDLLTGITIGHVAGSSMTEVEFRPILMVVGVLGLAVLDWLVSWLAMRWRGFGRKITFEPAVVIRQGKPIESVMRRLRLPMADLLPELRKKDIFDLREVDYAIFEPDGSVSVLKAAQAPKSKGLPQAVIVDGGVDEKVLHSLGWDQPRLLAELTRQGFARPQDILVATLDEGGTLFAAPKGAPESPPMHH